MRKQLVVGSLKAATIICVKMLKPSEIIRAAFLLPPDDWASLHCQR